MKLIKMKIMKLVKLITALLTIVVLGLVALPAYGQFGMGGPQARVEKLMQKFDSNQDGQISKEEALAVHMAFFAKADANSDGALSLDEFKVAREKRHEKYLNEFFTRVDVDKSGGLSIEEFLNAKKGRMGRADTPKRGMQDRFAKMDTDNNALLTIVELNEGRKAGIYGGRMAKMYGTPEERFAKMDADNNGAVSKAEFEINLPLFERFDANQDSMITPDEILNAMRQRGKDKAVK